MSIDLAIISNAYTPYRVALHRRIARELRGVRLHSLFTHELSNAPWAASASGEINAINFGTGEASDGADRLARAAHEWAKGGRILRYLDHHGVRAVVLLGYNDPGRLRILRGCRRRGIPCFLFGDSNIRGDRATGAKAAIKSAVVRWAVCQAAGVMACGSLGEAYFRKYGARDGAIFYFPYEPDYDLIRGITPQQVEQVRERFGLQAERRRIVFSGRLVRAKRPDLLIDAFRVLARQRPQWDLLMVGEGPMREDLVERIPEELQCRITWTGFLDDQATVSALYRASDLLVLPSEYEPWALVINEAVAAGLAVVSSDVVGAAVELVRGGLNGHLFPAGDMSALVERMLDATEASHIDRFKSASTDVLAEWRRRADPVAGLGAALQSVGLAVDDRH